MEEEKSYPISSVTISTEEYRDLVAEATSGKIATARIDDKYWIEREKVHVLEEELKATKDKLFTLIAQNDELAARCATLAANSIRSSFLKRLFRRIKGGLSC